MAPWRKAFLLLSLAGAPLFVLGMLTADPTRRLGVPDLKITASLLHFLRRRWQAIGLFVGVAGCLMIAVQALNQLIALALERRFDAPPASIGQVMGLIVLTATLGSLPVAGVLDRVLARRFGRAARPLLMGGAVMCAAPTVLLLAFVPTLGQAFMVIGVFLFLTCVANALVPTMLQDLTPASLRARSFAIWSLVVSIFSAAGPLLAGTMSDWVFNGHLLNAITVTAVPVLAVSALCAARSFRGALHNQSEAEPVL